jgi:hypothetical protein
MDSKLILAAARGTLDGSFSFCLTMNGSSSKKY